MTPAVRGESAPDDTEPADAAIAAQWLAVLLRIESDIAAEAALIASPVRRDAYLNAR